MRYWIGVASYDHVLIGVNGGFCQLGHGKKPALEKMQPNDWIMYYSPRQTLAPDSETLQSFTAIGQILATATYQADMGDFKPWRRDVAFLSVQPVPIRPLIEKLEFIKNPARWGYPFHRGHLEIGNIDFELIASMFGVRSNPLT
jgi:EVE domain